MLKLKLGPSLEKTWSFEREALDKSSLATLDADNCHSGFVPGAAASQKVVVDSSTMTSKGGVHTVEIKVKVPLILPISQMAAGEGVALDPHAISNKYCQAKLTLTLPNAHGLAATSLDTISDHGYTYPMDWTCSNRIAAATALNALLTLCADQTMFDPEGVKQPDSVLREARLAWNPMNTEVSSGFGQKSPLGRGFAGMVPVNDNGEYCIGTDQPEP